MNWRWQIAQFFELKWWLRYLKNKSKSEYLTWKRSYWENMLAKLQIEISDADKILDVGCGPAGIFTILDKHKIDAVDPLLKKYEENLKHFQESDYQQVNFIATSFENFEIPEKYDWVFCLNAINHVENLELCFQKLFQAVGEERNLVISIDTHNYKLLKFIFRLFPGDILHPHQYDLQDYKSMLENEGFKIQKVQLLKRAFIFNYHIIIAKK